MKRVLIVCTANVCRSPMALTVAQRLTNDLGLATQLRFDAAGTHASGRQKPDPRAVEALVKKGYRLQSMRSRRVNRKDFELSDLILAMDSANLASLQKVCPPEQVHKLHLFLEGTGDRPDASGINLGEVPDPYYGPRAGFDHVLDLCERGLNYWIQTTLPVGASSC